MLAEEHESDRERTWTEFSTPDMDKLQLKGQTWAEFSTLKVAIGMLHIYGVIK
jgi:hypothetical protein